MLAGTVSRRVSRRLRRTRSGRARGAWNLDVPEGSRDPLSCRPGNSGARRVSPASLLCRATMLRLLPQDRPAGPHDGPDETPPPVLNVARARKATGGRGEEPRAQPVRVTGRAPEATSPETGGSARVPGREGTASSRAEAT